VFSNGYAKNLSKRPDSGIATLSCITFRRLWVLREHTEFKNRQEPWSPFPTVPSGIPLIAWKAWKVSWDFEI
jgi:hypothetical protein